MKRVAGDKECADGVGRFAKESTKCFLYIGRTSNTKQLWFIF